MNTTETATEKITEWDYQSEEAIIVPYVPSIPGIFPETFLCELYTKLKKDGLLRMAFPGSSEFSLNWFISYFYSKTIIVAMKKPGEVIGFGWLYEVDGNSFKKASIGFAFWKKYWGEKVIQETARLGLSWFFQEGGINIIYATIGAWNRLSVRFAKVMGFSLIGRAPMFFTQAGRPIDVDLMVLKREDFFGKGER